MIVGLISQSRGVAEGESVVVTASLCSLGELPMVCTGVCMKSIRVARMVVTLHFRVARCVNTPRHVAIHEETSEDECREQDRG